MKADIRSAVRLPGRCGLVLKPWPLLEALAVAAAFAGMLAYFRTCAVDVAGGSDSYGYVSEALRLSEGHLYEPERVLSPFGLPEESGVTHPLAYAPRGSAGTVPTYPFGYPLLMAAALRLFGPAGPYWVTPALGAGAVVLTYLLARSWLGPTGGCLAGAVAFLLPTFVWGSIQPMSDVPATFFAALALVALLRPRPGPWADLLVGAAVGFAVWVRPNAAILVVPVAGWLLWRREWPRLARFGLALLPFVLVEGLVNQDLYGALWTTGYGQLPLAATPRDAAARALRHLRRLHDQQAGVGLLLVLLGLAVGRLRLEERILLAGVGGVFLAFFGWYAIDDAWSYGRFLLPGLPAVATLEAAGVVRLVEPGRLRLARLAALAAGLAVFAWMSLGTARDHGVFQTREWETRYVTAAWFARERAEQPALFLAMQHSGSLRFYAGLPTARYDVGPLPDLLRRIRKVSQAGGSVYLLADGSELDRIRASDRSALLVGAREVGRVEPGRVTLLRLDPPFVDPTELRPQRALQVAFADELALRDYDLSSASTRPGEALGLTLYWQALRAPEHDYTVFVHLVDADGKIVAQSDSYPVGGGYPTSSWRPEYLVRDVRRLEIPAGRRAGALRLVAGLYRLETMERLPARDGAGAAIGDYVHLGVVEIADR